MAYLVQGFCYGLVGLGCVISFLAGVLLIVSFISFMNWVGDKLSGKVEEDDDESEEWMD